MRRILVLVTFAASALGAAEPAFAEVPILLRTPGSQLVELDRGNGRAVIGKRGSVVVTLRGAGRLRIVDLPGSGRPRWSCGDKRETRVNPTTVQFRGPNLSCIVWSGSGGGPWQVVIRGQGIFASGRVRGSLTLDAPNEGPTGRYRIGNSSWKRWPRVAHTYVLRRN